MSPAAIQLIVLAAIALFVILRLRSVLGTRDGFEGKPLPKTPGAARQGPGDFEVIEGGLDRDIYDHVAKGSKSGDAFARMKKIESEFSVSEFQAGARQAYEMILMAFEKGDRDVLKQFLADDVFESFAGVLDQRDQKGLVVEADFFGVREVKIQGATFSDDTNEAEITMKFVGELTSVVKSADGDIVEGDKNAIKKQSDVWTFARTMGSDDPNWELVATGG